MASRLPTDEDEAEAIRRLLSGLAAGHDSFALADGVADLHPRHNTFPGEVFMGLAADALELCGVDRSNPISYEGLRETHLPERVFRGKENRKIQYAILTSFSLHAGLEPDLLDETIYWGDNYWDYALCATVALIRAGAEHANLTVTEVVGRLAERHNVTLA